MADEEENAANTYACGCRHKDTERSLEFQEDLKKRLNRAIGQLNGVKNMIDDNRYCGDVLMQLAAAEAAVRRVSELVLHDHLETCVVEQVKAGNTDVLDEVMDLIRTFKYPRPAGTYGLPTIPSLQRANRQAHRFG